MTNTSSLPKSQSTNHLLMIEPACFYANPETMATNAYQVVDDRDRRDIYQAALAEFRGFRDALVAKGVVVTSFRGFEDCPDMVFPNCMSSHRDENGVGDLYLYPMLNENRRAEHSGALVEMLSKSYAHVHDWRGFADEGKFLESTASICRDRVNKVGYVALSPRTDEELARRWLADKGYEAVVFETKSHAGIPVYHTDCVMWIGTSLAAFCAECIDASQRSGVLDKLSRHHEVLELDMDQLRAFCGNALEVRGAGGLRYLAMSSRAFKAFRNDQLSLIESHFDGGIIHSDLTTLETYGGGSARCCLMELF